MTKDYYKILGVDKNATKEEIKKAYKKLAMKFHPDRAPEEKKSEYEDKFKEINEAAAILADDEKRSQYDQFGTAESPFGGAGGFNFEDIMGGFDFDSIFESFFGGNIFGRRRRGPRRGSDLRYDMEITLEAAAEGTEKTIKIPHTVKCPECKGTGAKTREDIIECPQCDGSGFIKRTARTPFGMFSTQSSCPRCRGEGTSIKNPCKTCHGSGNTKKTSELEVKIPAGSETGTNLRITGAGEAGERGAPAGDLYIILHVKEHNLFERHGDDIYLEIPVTFTQAALGAKIEVPTLKGKAELKIPAGTQSHTIFKMRSKGIPHLHGSGSGDQLVKVILKTPKKLTAKQKDLLKQFNKTIKKKSLLGKLF
ncbi:molecular chaperone DnaJ [Candidatus Woesearchaeota archaeon]|nr:molecular chaperone DnaJ [Candidatus Woesearchaeota archaeon]